jgi:DNA gyrase subunit A
MRAMAQARAPARAIRHARTLQRLEPAYKKSARIVGDVIGKYHPHGDSAVYDTIVRMAQHFSLRYMLVDGQGNFGSSMATTPPRCVTPKSAWRASATSCCRHRQGNSRFRAELRWLRKRAADLPARIPNLLINGSSGIAVGMATNIPPHNLGEVIDACLCCCKTPTPTSS